jgi:hypothetical protein
MAKKKKVEKTKEELQQEQIERSISRIKDHLIYIPEPTYILDVGTPVRVGSLRDVTIEKVLFDGKAYLVDYTSFNNNYGRPILTPNRKNAFNWFDVRKKVDPDTEVLLEKEDLRLHYSQRSLRDMLSKVYHFGLDFDPEYQREHVWDLEDKVKLIDSIFNNIDIGKFVYVHLTDYSAKYLYEILDGKQRIRAICDYFEDRFQYKGKYFSDLSNRDQGHFEDYPISHAEIQEASYEQKLKYFIKLNTGGRVMSQEHLDKVRGLLDATK